MTHDSIPGWCLRLLRRFREATLAFGDRTANVRFVIDRTDGRIVMPVEAEAARHAEFTLHLPSQSDCDATALLIPTRIERPEASEAVDRWSVYHGTPPTSAIWTSSRILGIKSMTDAQRAIMDEAILTTPNILGAAEFPLIRRANAEPARLAAATRAVAGIHLDNAACIGVDPNGIDVRAPFGIVRLEFPATADTVAAAEAMLDAILTPSETNP